MDIEKLRAVIDRKVENLETLPIDSDQYKAEIDNIAKLMDRLIEMEKVEVDKLDKAENRKNEKTDRLVKNILTGASIVIPSVLTVWGTCKSIKFEETGTFTTIMGRGFISKLLPRK